MRKTICASAIAVAVILMTGCASTDNTPTQSEYSGFLGDYSNLQQTQDPNGETFLRYVNPKLNPMNYSAVIGCAPATVSTAIVATKAIGTACPGTASASVPRTQVKPLPAYSADQRGLDCRSQ